MDRCAEVLTDTTTFTLAQQIFDNPGKTHLNQLRNLDAMIKYLMFYDTVWIIPPTVFGANIHVNTPPLVSTFIDSGIVKEYPPKFYSNTVDFLKDQYEDLKSLIAPNSLKNFCVSHKEIQSDLREYESYYHFSSQKEVQELAHEVGIRDCHLIPPVVHLVRSQIYLQTVQEMKGNSNTVITYSPHFMRASIVDGLLDIRKNKLQELFDSVFKELESRERAEREYYSRTYGIRVELDLPILTTTVLDQCTCKDDVVDEIISLRKEKDTKSIRDFFGKIQIAVEDGDFDAIKRYDRRLRELLDKLQINSSTHDVLHGMPVFPPRFLMDVGMTAAGLFTFAATADPEGAVTAVGGVSGGVTDLREYLSRRDTKRDTIFLANLKQKVDNINCSRDEFRRVFGCELL